jgi:hypothetical protein
LHEAAFAHDKAKTDRVVAALRLVEDQCLADLMATLKADQPVADGDTLFKEAVEAETRIYKNADSKI